VASLKNLGNTCFMNCILQALGSSPAFVSYLRHIQGELDQARTACLLQAEAVDKGEQAELEWSRGFMGEMLAILLGHTGQHTHTHTHAQTHTHTHTHTHTVVCCLPPGVCFLLSAV
jgi:hypothetical protein